MKIRKNNKYFVDSFAKFKTLQGKQVSYNNIADSNAAWEIVQNFSPPSCAIIKHANPCGVSSNTSAFVVENNKKKKIKVNNKVKFSNMKMSVAFHGGISLNQQKKIPKILKLMQLR